MQPNPYGQKSAQPNPYSVKQEALPSLEGPCAAADSDTKSVVKVKREDVQSDRKANLTNGISDFDLVRARQGLLPENLARKCLVSALPNAQ